MLKTVHILVGPSGSGKTTWANNFLHQEGAEYRFVVLCSADEFRMVGEEYVFDPTKTAEVHSQCFNKFLLALQRNDVTDVVVDNTNIHAWERQNYIEAARIARAEIMLHVWEITFTRDIVNAAARNSHGVDLAIVARQAATLQKENLLAATKDRDVTVVSHDFVR